MPKFDVFGPLPFDRDLTRTYDLVPAATPLEALLVVHRDALGRDRVKLRGDQIVFADADDLWLAVGRWRITQAGWNGDGGTVVLTILPPDGGDDRSKKDGSGHSALIPAAT